MRFKKSKKVVNSIKFKKDAHFKGDFENLYFIAQKISFRPKMIRKCSQNIEENCKIQTNKNGNL